jgi:NADPH:quinone reductase-like Zn-dependent oxidoreductase
MDFPRIQGSETAGRIVDAGSWVLSARIGQRVIVDPTLYAGGGEGLYDCDSIASERDGGFAE